MIIRDEQKDAFQAADCGRFQEACIGHLRETYPDETEGKSNGEMENLVHDGVGGAARYGIRRESDVLRFIEVRLALGDEFETEEGGEWAAEILNNESMGGPEKTDRLYLAAMTREREEREREEAENERKDRPTDEGSRRQHGRHRPERS